MLTKQVISRAPGRGVLVILLVALAILVCELLHRTVESTLSDNIAHLNGIPELGDKLDQTQPNSLSVIGNSLANSGFDLGFIISDAAIGRIELGDIVYSDEYVFLYFAERSDQQIDSSGYRIAPSELEGVLIESGLIEFAAAVGTPDGDSGQRNCVAVMPATANDDEFANRNVCTRELPPYMQPSKILISGGIPLTANGKPSRSAVVELVRNRAQSGH